jgi:hypothetical protein
VNPLSLESLSSVLRPVINKKVTAVEVLVMRKDGSAAGTGDI